MASETRAFLSYSRKDVYAAEQLGRALTRSGLSVWWDLSELAPGDDWSATIDREIETTDCFVLLASRAAFASENVMHEIDVAVESGRSIFIVRAHRVAIPNELRRFASCDIWAGPHRAARSIGRGLQGLPPRRIAAALALVVRPVGVLVAALPMLSSSILLLLMAFVWLRASQGALRDEWHVSLLGGWAMQYRYYGPSSTALFLALSATMALCAGALVRRDWRTSYLIPVMLCYLSLGLESREIALLGAELTGTETGPLGAFTTTIGHLAGVVTVLGIPTLLLLIMSPGILRHSRAGCGSSVARFLPLLRTDHPLVVAFLILTDKAPSSWIVEEMWRFFEDGADGTGARAGPTFHIDADPSDAGIERAFERILVAIGMRSVGRSEADQRFKLVTNANVRDLSWSENDHHVPFYVIGSPVDIGDDDRRLSQYHWVDFRSQAIGLTNAGRILRRAPQFPLPPSLPVGFGLFRAPLQVAAQLVVAQVMGLTFLAVVLSNAVHLWTFTPFDVIRVLTAAGCFALLFQLRRTVAGRREPLSTVARLRRSVLACCLAFAVLSAVDDQLNWIPRVLATAIGLSALLPFSSFLRSTDEDNWFPSHRLKNAVLGPASNRHPLTVTSAAAVLLLLVVNGAL